MIGIEECRKGNKQLSPVETEDTKRVAAVCMHVERVTGMVKPKYPTLKHMILVSLLHSLEGDSTSVDKIVKSMLCRLQCLSVCHSSRLMRVSRVI